MAVEIYNFLLWLSSGEEANEKKKEGGKRGKIMTPSAHN